MNLLSHFKELISSFLTVPDKKNNYYKIFTDALNIKPGGRYIFSTAEHLAPFNYASTVSNIYPLAVIHDSIPDFFDGIICMAGSLIPLDNEDYPKGIIGIDHYNNPIRINLKTKKLKKSFSLALKATNVSSKEVEKIDPNLKDILYSSSSKNTYAEQLIYITTKLYDRWKIPRKKPLPLIIYSLEKVALTILTELILNKDPIINAILFDQKIRENLYELLKNIPCAWSDQKGTFLFWYSNKNKLHRMEEVNGNLVSSDYRVNLSVKSILQAIEKQELYPCGFLSLLCVSYLPGIPTIGGINQFKYYQSMIHSMNSLDFTCRSSNLSLYGYGTADFNNFRINHKDSLPQQGAGVFLGLKETSLDIAMEELERMELKKF